MLVNKTDQVKENERKIKMLSNELKSCLEAWEREKSELKIKGIESGDNVQLNSKYQKLI